MSRLAATLQHDLRATWADHAIAGRNNVTVVVASPGAIVPPMPHHHHCSSPSLYIFLVGHLRTFAWTHAFFAQVAQLSAPSCSFIAACVPDVIDASAATYTPGALGRVDNAGLKQSLGTLAFGDSAASLVRHVAHTTFRRPGAPLFAYAVVSRVGFIDRYPACLPFGWHAVWALAEWAANHHGFTPDPSAVVLRTRPDVLLSTPLDIRGLRAYFSHGEHGRHLALGQSVHGRYSWKVGGVNGGWCEWSVV